MKMKDLNVGAIPVCDEGALLGMVTDRDLGGSFWAVADNKSWGSLDVEVGPS